MSVGKSSISRMTKVGTTQAEGIRSLAPEVPIGDPAIPVKKETTTKKETTKKTTTTSKATKAAPTKTAIPTQKKTKKLSTIAIGQALPVWLL